MKYYHHDHFFNATRHARLRMNTILKQKIKFSCHFLIKALVHIYKCGHSVCIINLS